MVPSSSKLRWTVQRSWKERMKSWRVTGRVKTNPKPVLRKAVPCSELLGNSKSHHSKLPRYIYNIQLLHQTGGKTQWSFLSSSHPLHLSFQMCPEQLEVPGWIPMTAACLLSQRIKSRLIDIRGIFQDSCAVRARRWKHNMFQWAHLRILYLCLHWRTALRDLAEWQHQIYPCCLFGQCQHWGLSRTGTSLYCWDK